MKEGRCFIIYAILEPGSGQVVYVGQTGNFEQRKRGHLGIRKRPNIKTQNIKTWMFDQISAGQKPTFKILQVIDTEDASYGAEDKWVKHFADQGHPLLNRWRHHREIIQNTTKAPGFRG